MTVGDVYRSALTPLSLLELAGYYNSIFCCRVAFCDYFLQNSAAESRARKRLLLPQPSLASRCWARKSATRLTPGALCA